MVQIFQGSILRTDININPNQSMLFLYVFVVLFNNNIIKDATSAAYSQTYHQQQQY
jgi:hypothetical protein